MSGTIPPLPQYASMAWCSVKAQGQLYFTLIYFTCQFNLIYYYFHLKEAYSVIVFPQ